MEGSSTSPNNNTPINTNSNWQPWPEEALTMARTALDLTRQDWSLTGQTISSPSPTPSSTTPQQTNTNSGPPILPHNIYNHPTLGELGNKVGREEIVDRMVSLLFVRIVALVTCRLGNTVPRSSTSSPNNIGGHGAWDNTESIVNDVKGSGGEGSKANKNSLKKRRQKIYTDYSTTTICKAALQLNNPPTPPPKQENTPQQQLTTSCVEAEHSHSHDEHVDGPMDKGYHSEPGTRHELNNKKIKNHRRASDNPPSPPTKKDIYGANSNGQQPNNPPPSHLLFPSSITPQVIQQLRHYVTTICNQYHTPSNVPYHNVEHAYHVFLSANKLLDLMLCESPEDYITPALMNGSSSNKGGGVGNNVNFITSQMGNMAGIVPSGVPPSSSTMAVIKRRSRRRSSVDSTTSNLSTNTRHRPTFGLKSDPLSQLAYLFSALVHDVDHTGISNRQLVLESDDLAILYNDQSVAEQRSLAVAFTTLKKNGKGKDGDGGYKELREVLFPEQPTPELEEGGTAAAAAPSENEDFFKFRKLVIDLVLVTDIASPERTQIVKSKWKEAFGDVIVAEKLKKSATQQLRKAANKVGSSRGREYYRVDRNKIQTLDPTAEDETPQGDNVGNGSSNTMTKGTLAGGPKLIPTRRKYNKGSSGSLDQEGRSKSKGKSKSGGGANDTFPEQVQPRSTTPTTSNNQRAQYSSSLVSATDSNCDSIYFDSSDSSLSDMNSLDDDFDASAVSRSKMNFDSLDASTNSNMSDMNASDFNSSGTSGGDNINRRGSDNSGEGNDFEINQVSGGPVGGSTKANRDSRGRRASQGEETTPTSSGSGTRGGVDPLSKRWSTGDLTDDVDLNNNSSSPQQPKSPRGRASSSSNKVNQTARTSRPSTSKSFTISSKTSSGSPSNSRRRNSALSRPLSQSMVSHKDLRRARPRAHSEERRLGVRRALDLAGSTIIAYNNLRGSVGSERSSLLSNSGGASSGDDCIEDEFDPDDDVDEFKATVVLEQMIRAADVAALLQDWNNTMKWSTRLYKELKNGCLQNRGEDPIVGWFENQIKFFDFYILPLAKNLGVMGVFEESVGSMFVYCVKSNLARWIEEGSRETELMIKQDADERKRSQEGQQSVNSLAKDVESIDINPSSGNEGDKVQPPPALSNGDDSQPPPI